MLPSQELQPEPLPLWPLAAVTTVVVTASFFTVGLVAQVAQVVFGLWFTSLVVFFGLPFALSRAAGLSAVRTLGLPAFPRGLGLGFLLGALNLPVVMALQALAQQVFPKAMVEQFDGGAQIFERQTAVELLLIAVAVGVLAPLGEETFFRGVLQRGLSERFRAPVAVGVTAALFSATHLDPVGFVSRLQLGLLFGWLAWRSKSTWPGVGAHAANNLVFTLLYLWTRDEPDEGEPPLVPMLIIGGVALLVVLGLSLWLHRHPKALVAPVPAETAPRPPPLGWRAFLPWVAATLVGVALAGALDWRGVALNLHDVLAGRPPGGGKHQPEWLGELRSAARRGDVPLEGYLSAARQRR